MHMVLVQNEIKRATVLYTKHSKRNCFLPFTNFGALGKHSGNDLLDPYEHRC